MPGLMRGMARTAAVVGTATATRNAVNRRQADKNAQAYSQAMASAAPPPQEVVYVEAPPAPAAEEDVITQLERLGALKAQGIITKKNSPLRRQSCLECKPAGPSSRASMERPSLAQIRWLISSCFPAL